MFEGEHDPPRVKRAVEAIVHVAGAKDPDECSADASAMAADFDRFLSGRPVATRLYSDRFDEREIGAERPRMIVVLGMAVGTSWVGLGLLAGRASARWAAGIPFTLLAQPHRLCPSGALTQAPWTDRKPVALSLLG
jgi:hypothetical protein